MAEHSLYYYPYAQVGPGQGRLLRMAALYFDEMRMLSPFDAHVGGVGFHLHTAEMEALGDVVKLVPPSAVVAEHRKLLAELIREDLDDPNFVAVCAESRHDTWQVSLAKIPGTERDHARAAASSDPTTITDNAMRILLRDDIPSAVSNSLSTSRHYTEQLVAYAEYHEVHDAFGETPEGDAEYRVVDLPVEVGESLLLNHALLGSMVDPSGTVTPITDDPFHRRAMRVKLDRLFARQDVRRQFDSANLTDHLAVTTMKDWSLHLPALRDDVPLDEVLKLREDRGEEFAATRQVFARIADGIDARPWDGEDYTRAVQREVDKLRGQLEETKEAIDSWADERRTSIIKSGGAAASLVGAAIPLTLAAGALGLVAAGAALLGTVFGAVDLVPKVMRKAPASTGLEYLLQAP